MPRFLSALTTVAVAGACTALVLAQETQTPGNVSPPPPAAAESSAPVSEASKPKGAESPSGRSKSNHTAASKKPPLLPSPEATPAPTPKPRKPSVFDRFFGPRKPKATPTPTPSPTPAATNRSHRKGAIAATPAPVKPVPSTGRKGAAAATPAPAAATPVPSATPKPGKPGIFGKKPEKQPQGTPAPPKPDTGAKPPPATPTPLPPPTATPPVGKKGRGKPTTAPTAPEAAEVDPEVKEKVHFEAARAKALEDPQVKSLKAKADEATADEDSKKALRAYNKALYDKIRKIDGSVTDRANQLEAAILKRLNE